MDSPKWRDLAYPDEPRPYGVVEDSIGPIVRELIRDLAPRVKEVLKTKDRNVLGDCGFATIAWAGALASAGLTVRRVGGFGEHEITVPPTPVEQLGGYLTDDDGLVQHWWLMVDPDGSLFDPTAHQFDARGGIRLKRYRVEGSPVHRWRLEWPACAGHFPPAGAAITPNAARRLLRR